MNLHPTSSPKSIVREDEHSYCVSCLQETASQMRLGSTSCWTKYTDMPSMHFDGQNLRHSACFPLQALNYVIPQSSLGPFLKTMRHFANIVPPRAASCPTLLNDIFALSSRHLSLNALYDPYASDRYHQACLRHLATISNDDNLLAATILLRTLEELDVPLIGTDHEGHLLGIQLSMNTCDSTTTPSSLRLASFWVGMRQEVTMSFASQRPVKIRLDHAFMDRSLSEADDDTWANRIIVHSADVINYCFGNNGPNGHRYQELVDYDQAWLRARPVSWLPIAYSASDETLGEAFPHIIYLNHAVVIGQVHSIFARILLMCHDDRVPRIGPSAQLARKQIDVG
ncbi:ARCA-like protein [Fusarium bulbicola]|nr:ARCA-like protein [Fusarium bulbicola]